MKFIRRTLKRYQGIILAITILLVCVVSVFYVIIPAIWRTLSLWSEVRTEQNQMRDLRSKVTFLQSFDQETLRDALMIVTSAIPIDKSLPSLMMTVEDAAVRSGGMKLVDLTLIQPGSLATESARRQSTEEAKLGSFLMPFVVTAEGSYEQIRSFIETTASVRRFMRVKNFSISSQSAETFSMRVMMDAFYAPLPKSTGDVTVKLTPLSEKDNAILAKVSAMPWLAVRSDQTTISPTVYHARPNPFSP